MADINQLYRIAAAARRYKLVHTTLYTAVMRGDLAYTKTACGLHLVHPGDVERWLHNRPKRGRPPKPLTHEGQDDETETPRKF